MSRSRDLGFSWYPKRKLLLLDAFQSVKAGIHLVDAQPDSVFSYVLCGSIWVLTHELFANRNQSSKCNVVWRVLVACLIVDTSHPDNCQGHIRANHDSLNHNSEYRSDSLLMSYVHIRYKKIWKGMKREGGNHKAEFLAVCEHARLYSDLL